MDIRIHENLVCDEGSIFNQWIYGNFLILFFKRFYLFFREREREGEREGEKHQYVRETSISCLSHALSWGPGTQARHVPQLGIEPVTFWFTGWHSTH